MLHLPDLPVHPVPALLKSHFTFGAGTCASSQIRVIISLKLSMRFPYWLIRSYVIKASCTGLWFSCHRSFLVAVMVDPWLPVRQELSHLPALSAVGSRP